MIVIKVYRYNIKIMECIKETNINYAVAEQLKGSTVRSMINQTGEKDTTRVLLSKIWNIRGETNC